MNLEHVEEVAVVAGEEAANARLREGWVLLQVAPAGGDAEGRFHYALGRLTPCPEPWREFLELEGLEALARHLELTPIRLRLLARGDFAPSGTVIARCREFAARHNVPSPI